MRSPVERRACATRAHRVDDAEGFETDPALDELLDGRSDDEHAAVSFLAGGDAVGPLDPMDDEELLGLPEDAPSSADDLLGPEEVYEDAAIAGDDDAFAMAADDAAVGPLLDDEADLGLSEQDEPVALQLDSDDEGVPVDDATFDLVDFPPLGEDLDDGALFDEALDDLELDPEPGLPPGQPIEVPAEGLDPSPAT